MGQVAPRVCTDEAGIQRLLDLITRLPAHGRVVLHMRDGTTQEGVVHVRTSAQVFRDPQRREGTNAVVSLERPGTPGRVDPIWLDEVARVDYVGPARAAEN
jgi:hypothetical protein